MNPTRDKLLPLTINQKKYVVLQKQVPDSSPDNTLILGNLVRNQQKHTGKTSLVISSSPFGRCLSESSF
jgi:hypothetical protein